MAKKIWDLAVKVGTKSDGKGRYKNIGAMLEGDNGPFLVIEKTFNPAGVNTEKDSILVSMFKPRDKDGNAPAAAHDTGEDIPF